MEEVRPDLMVDAAISRGEAASQTLFHFIEPLWTFRYLLWSLVVRDLKVRYRRSVLGFGWALLNPILMTAIFSIVFTVFFRPPETAVPFPLFFLTGVLAWNLCTTSLVTALRSITDNATIVTKIYFPRSVLSISAVLASTIHFALGVAVLIPVTFFFGVRPSIALLLLPIILVAQILFLCGVGLVLSAVNVFFRDAQPIFDVLLQAWFFATPIVYDLRQVPPSSNAAGFAGLVDMINPMAPIVTQYRMVLLEATAPEPLYMARTLLVGLLVFLLGATFFERWAGRLGDEL
jgi:ABC-type polysaccharide/polyol phosphate export permease